MDPQEAHRQKAMIEAAAEEHNLTVKDWGEDDDGVRANLGEWYALEDDANEFYSEGEKGTLIASVVGAQKYHNERVYFGFMPEGSDASEEVRYPLDVLEPVTA